MTVPTNPNKEQTMSQSPDETHDCYPTNERYPRCVTCGREMDPGIGGDADRAWFAEQRRRIRERSR